MRSDIDTSFIFKEKGFYIGHPPLSNASLKIEESMLNPCYFDFVFGQKKENSYHVPIGFHPYIYFKSYWKNSYGNGKRIRSLFMAGNFSKTYANDYNEKFFGVLNRNYLKYQLEEWDLISRIEAKDEQEFFNLVKEESIVLVDRINGFQIHPIRILEFLSRFEFFFALPGMYMPMCHNLIEAMAVGMIPFLQEGYAKTFVPALENGVNCVTFSSIEDLNERIEFLFSLNSNTIEKLRFGVRKFYQEHFTAESVVKRIIEGSYSTIYLMAEKYSVDQMKNNLPEKT
jgi:hypothetical protein